MDFQQIFQNFSLGKEILIFDHKVKIKWILIGIILVIMLIQKIRQKLAPKRKSSDSDSVMEESTNILTPNQNNKTEKNTENVEKRKESSGSEDSVESFGIKDSKKPSPSADKKKKKRKSKAKSLVKEEAPKKEEVVKDAPKPKEDDEWHVAK